MFENKVFQALSPLVGGRVFPDIAPLDAVRPYATYQQVGGLAINYLEAVPVGLRNARVQVNIWGTRRLEVSALAKQAEDAIVIQSKATVEGAMVATYDAETESYGTRQDFSIWF